MEWSKDHTEKMDHNGVSIQNPSFHRFFCMNERFEELVQCIDLDLEKSDLLSVERGEIFGAPTTVED